MSFDVHQHLWPEPLLAALRARHEPPWLDGWTLQLPGDAPYPVDPAAHDPAARAAGAQEDVVCVALSAGLGIDRLPPGEAAELVAAWHAGALALPPPFRAWAAAGTREPDPEALAGALDAGAIGLELPAGVLADPGGLDRLAPLLAVLEERCAPLLVHPGLAPTPPGRPAWWTPVVPYVTTLHAAWWAWADGGRERHPDLPVCFAALAGLGPLHSERRRARGGGRTTVDPLTFVETSSYGPQAVDAVIRVLGIDVICHGSDRPYAEPADLRLGHAAAHALRTVNPGRLFAHVITEVTT